jgi:hypothetical protein
VDSGSLGIRIPLRSAALYVGVQRLATALTEPDPADQVCRQTATKGNSTELLLIRCNALLIGGAYRINFAAKRGKEPLSMFVPPCRKGQ